MASADYGRDLDRERIQARSGVIVVAGDSGIGKSSFVASLRSHATPGEIVADAQVLRAVQGSLQNAIALALGDCLSQYSAEVNDLPWARVRAAVERASTAARREIGQILVSRAIEFLDSKLGKDATKVIRGVVGDLLGPRSHGLDDELRAFSTPDVAQEIARLVHEFAGKMGTTLVLPLDSAERLTQEDRNLLVELATELGAEARLVVAVNDQHPEGKELLRLVEARDSRPYELGPLAPRAIEEWLLSANVPKVSWPQIMRISDGYPLFIGDAIRLVRNGMSVADIQSPASFESVFDRSWRRLDPAVQHVVFRIAGFAEPPPQDFLCTYLDVTPLQWSVLRSRLLDEGVFIRRADESIWFHDRRRAYLWDRRMTVDDRSHVAAEALASFREQLDASGRAESWLFTSAPALSAALPLEQADEWVSRILGVPDNELALLASMLEVSEPSQDHGVVHTEEVVRYASARFSFAGDPIVALESLLSEGLIVLSSNRYASVAAPVIPSLFALAALIGETERRLGLRVFPGRALKFFDAYVRPLLGIFDEATTSLVPGTVSHHGRMLTQLGERQKSSRATRTMNGLGLSLTADDQPMAVTAIFSGRDERDKARAAFEAGYNDTGLRHHLSVDGVIDLPSPRVHYARYRRLLDQHGLSKGKTPIHSVDDIVALLDRRAAAFSSLRDAMGEYEASALEFDTPRRYILDTRGAPSSSAEYEIATPRSRATTTSAPDLPNSIIDDPLLELRLRAQGMLDADERLVHWAVHMRTTEREEPVVDLVQSLEKRGRDFNRSLPPVKVALDAKTLTYAIEAESLALRSLEESLVMSGVLPGPASLRDDSLYLVLDVHAPNEDRWYPWGATTYWVRDGRAAVHTLILDEGRAAPRMFASHDELKSIGIRDPDLVSRSGDGIASSVLARLLGYDTEDIHIDDPRFPAYR